VNEREVVALKNILVMVKSAGQRAAPKES